MDAKEGTIWKGNGIIPCIYSYRIPPLVCSCYKIILMIINIVKITCQKRPSEESEGFNEYAFHVGSHN